MVMEPAVREPIVPALEKRFVEEAVVAKKVVEVALPKVTFPVKVLAPLHVLMSERRVEDAEEPLERQVPFTAKQPAPRLMPLAAVEVAEPVTLSAVVCNAPENVEVELVPATVRKPWMVEVPVVPPWIVVVALPPIAKVSRMETRVVDACPRVVSPVTESVPEFVVFPAVSVPTVAELERRSVEDARPET